jgi:KAP-like P-loop domain-containing protein
VREFIAKEWTKALIGAAIGVIGAILKELLADDDAFRAAVSEKWKALATHPGFAGLDSYLPLFAILVGILAIVLILKLLPFFIKALKSWIFGVVSGLVVWWAISFFFFFTQNSPLLFQQLKYAVFAAVFLTLVSIALRIRAVQASSRIPTSVSFALPTRGTKATQEDNLSKLDPDSPIEEWNQDVLERSALVESLATTVIVSKAPVVAIQGPFGDGKSSVLNLLKRTLEPHAIVISFSTWLPGSEQTLAIDMFNDVATECKKRYYLPQLRRRLLKYAKTVCGTVSFLKEIPELLPSISQREEIEEIGKALSRVPRRIVVLLDEMDRLEKDELQVLLKILRGVAFFPNLSYVCAFDRTEIEKKLFGKQNAESREYCEKFFPVSFAVPKPDAALLFRVLQSRLAAVFDDLNWFQTDAEKKQFTEKLQQVWDETLVQLCTNLRKIAFVVNDVSVAARRLVREVNAVDVVVIETLRRFFPGIYEVVWRNQLQFIESQISLKTPFRSEDSTKRERTAFFDALKPKLEDTGQSKEASELLVWLFPAYVQYLGGAYKLTGRLQTANLETAEKEKRIFHPDFFPLYFRYQVPETMFSETDLESFIKGMNSLSSLEDCITYFSNSFTAVPKGSPRREDFLHRVALSVERFKDLQAEALAYAVAHHARDYVYDVIMFVVAEAGRALVIIFEVAQRFVKSSKVQQVLERSIAESTDDTFALRMLTLSTEPERNKILLDFSHVNKNELTRVFAERMERRYGPHADISKVNIAEGDRSAFVVWAKSSDKSREIEIEFWRRLIGTSRKRLAQAVDFIFPVRGVLWESDPTPHVELLFPIAEFKNLLEKLQSGEELDDNETQALDRLQRLISGEFKNGVPRDW